MKTMMIIEGDRDYSFTLKNAFGTNYKYYCFSSIEDFENNGKHVTPDIVLVDYYLPDGNAPGLIKKLKSKSMSLPVIAMSQSNEPNVWKESILAGGSYFFRKDKAITKELLSKVKMLEGRS